MKTKRNKPHQRFDLRRRELDGKIVKWELKRLSELGLLIPMDQPEKGKAPFDHEVWVVTGVFNHRREAFA